MIIQPGDRPGSCERHVLRKAGNPLFGDPPLELDDDHLLDAQQQDHVLQEAFLHEFHALLQQATLLEATAESEAVLALKDRLDRAYETASAVAGDQTEVRQAIRQLLDLTMAAVRKGAGDDPQAQHELEQEIAARDAHFRLLESSLVADLLNPDSVITARELVPVLLCAARDDLLLAVQLFDLEQLPILLGQGREIVQRLEGSAGVREQAEQRLQVIEGYVKFLQDNLQL